MTIADIINILKDIYETQFNKNGEISIDSTRLYYTEFKKQLMEEQIMQKKILAE